MGLKSLFGRWISSAEHKLLRRQKRAAPRAPGEPPPWQYPDPFSGELVTPPNDVNPARLERAGLPVLGTLQDLTRATGLTWQKILWLAAPSTAYSGGSPHYFFFTLAKSGGGDRLILAPKPELKSLQRWIHHHILDLVPLSDCVHGFRRGHSTHTNALPHCDKEVVARFDLEDFFHSITYRRIRGLFRSLGYSTEVSVLLGLLTTFRPSSFPYEYMRHLPTLVWLRSMGSHHRTYRGYPTTPPFLPQGAPTSPTLANLIARNLDRRMEGLAGKFSATYTRYADDLTFSGGAAFRRDLGRFLPLVKRIVSGEGFFLARGKQRIRRKGGRQSVTGLVVNRRPNVPREAYRRLRVLLHKALTLGPERIRLEGTPFPEPIQVRNHLEGWVAYIHHVNPARGSRLKHLLDQVRWPEEGGAR